MSGLKWISSSSCGPATLAFALLLLRASFGAMLVYGVQDNVADWDRMLEFRDFLHDNGFPQPLLAAIVSVYAQLAAGLMIVVGALTRLAALAMVFNFVVAILAVHLDTPFSVNIAPFSMLVFSSFLLLAGAGGYSIDAWREGRRR